VLRRASPAVGWTSTTTSGLPIADQPVWTLLGSISDEQIVDLVVAIYELWLDLRTTDYVTGLVEAGVDLFFHTYGGFDLEELLTEFGLARDDLVEEALRFGPPAIEALAKTGALQDLLRRRLASFYHSPQAAALLADVATEEE
jgi:hypothetical protein